MATRLHRIGNIYSRIDGLIRKGHLDVNEKPIWFDVYKRFPPKYEPTFKRRAPDVKVREIFYKEDLLRAKIQNAFHGELGEIDLTSKREPFSETLLKSCQQYISEGMSEDEALEKVKISLASSREGSASSPTETSKENLKPEKKSDLSTLLNEILV